MAILEKRNTDRFSMADEMAPKSVDIYSSTIEMETHFEGEMLNVSSGGLCCSITGPLEEFSIVRVLIPLSKDLPQVPMLGQVRWIKANHKSYVVGMRFIV